MEQGTHKPLDVGSNPTLATSKHIYGWGVENHNAIPVTVFQSQKENRFMFNTHHEQGIIFDLGKTEPMGQPGRVC